MICGLLVQWPERRGRTLLTPAREFLHDPVMTRSHKQQAAPHLRAASVVACTGALLIGSVPAAGRQMPSRRPSPSPRSPGGRPPARISRSACRRSSCACNRFLGCGRRRRMPQRGIAPPAIRALDRVVFPYRSLVYARGFLCARLLHEVVPNLGRGAVLAADGVAVDG